MKAIIFGINGQDGYYLDQLLRRNKIEVIGISRSGKFIKGNVNDFAFVEEQIKINRPEYIFHLAANSSTSHSVLFENHQTICTGTLNILECAKLHCPQTKIFLAGSALQFRNDGLPIDENTPFEARSAYSVARIQSVYAGRYYRKTFGLRIYVGYFFNHDSPFRTENHVNQKIIKAVKRIQNGSKEKLELGNIDVRKEFNFAGDCIEAVWKLINQDSVFEAVIGSGKAYSIKQWVATCFDNRGVKWEDHVVLSKDYKPEYSILVSNPALIKSLGWEFTVDFNKLAIMMLNN